MIDFEELREKISNTEVKNGNIIGCVANYVGTPVMDAIMKTIKSELGNDELEYAIVSTGVADGYGDNLCERVNKMIQDGWIPHGGIATPIKQKVGLIQAMVRRKRK